MDNPERRMSGYFERGDTEGVAQALHAQAVRPQHVYAKLGPPDSSFEILNGCWPGRSM